MSACHFNFYVCHLNLFLSLEVSVMCLTQFFRADLSAMWTYIYYYIAKFYTHFIWDELFAVVYT